MVIFRENTEDIYAGIEYRDGTPEAEEFSSFFAGEFPKQFKKIRFPGIVERHRHQADQREGTERLVRAGASSTPIDQRQRKSVTLVHKGNIMKFTEGAFRDWGYELAKRDLRRGRDRRRPVVPIPRQAGRRHRHQGRDRRHHPPADPDAARRVRRHRHAEPERRLPLRRAGGAGRRHRHRAGRQHQLRHRPRHLRGDPRHGAEVRRPGQGQPGLGDPLRRDDAPLHGLGRGGRPASSRAWTARSPPSASPTTSRA